MDPEALREDAAVELPSAHCAFLGCTGCFESGEQLSQHPEADPEHNTLLSAVTRNMSPSQDSEQVRRFSAYCEAIAMKIRDGAPLDTYSIDRRAMKQYTRATADDQIYMPMCFSCARRFPFIASLETSGKFPWRLILRLPSTDRKLYFYNSKIILLKVRRGPKTCTRSRSKIFVLFKMKIFLL